MRLTNVEPMGSGECLHFANPLPGTEKYPDVPEDKDSIVAFTSPSELRLHVTNPKLVGQCGGIGDIYLVEFTPLKVVEPAPTPAPTVDEQEFAAGAELAMEGKPLPDEASASARKGFDQMTAKLKAENAVPPPA